MTRGEKQNKNTHSDHKGAVPVGVFHATVAKWGNKILFSLLVILIDIARIISDITVVATLHGAIV